LFRHTDYLQFDAWPEKPDPVYAHKLQELIGGAYGEMTVARPRGNQLPGIGTPRREGRRHHRG
jgi:Mn-containing catalase